VGKDYMPLSKDFKNISPKHKNFLNLTILISFGGFDLEGLALKAIHALNQLNQLNIKKVIIISNEYSERKVQELLNTVSFGYQLHISPSNLGFAYAESDICIGSSGVSSFERAYFEIPQLIFVKAHNQVETAKNLSQRNMANSVCNFMQSNVTESIKSFANVKNLNKIHKNLKNFINLNGSSKIANEIKILLNAENSTND
jgi:spore coat polysaccharide biosynthesis predicted glycosyltransferase SpsG